MKMVDWEIKARPKHLDFIWVFSIDIHDGGTPFVVEFPKPTNEKRNIFQAWNRAKEIMDDKLNEEINNAACKRKI